MTLSVNGFGGNCITTSGWGCKTVAVVEPRIREVLRTDSGINRLMNLDSPLLKRPV